MAEPDAITKDEEIERLRERVASLMLEEPYKTAGLYAAIDELRRDRDAWQARAEDTRNSKLTDENARLRMALHRICGLTYPGVVKPHSADYLPERIRTIALGALGPRGGP